MNPTATVRIVILLLFATWAAGCGRKVEGAGEGPQAMPVKVQVAQLQRVPQYTEYIATLKSRRASVLQPDVEGQVRRIYVQSGDRVKPGQALLEIDQSKQEATVTSQEASRRARLAALELNRTELERKKRLFAAGVVSKQELDQAQSTFEASEAEVEALGASVREQQVQLRYYTVKAPHAGTVGDIPVRVGDRVKPDTVLTTVDEGGELEAYISIPAEKASAVRIGTPVEVLGENDRAAARARVDFISPRVDAENQLLLLKATVPNPRGEFRNDQVVHARVIWQESEHPLVPVTAIARLTGQTFAYVAESDGKQTVARQRSVRLGEVVGNDYVVLDGIKPGDKVITTGVQMLADGVPVAPEG